MSDIPESDGPSATVPNAGELSVSELSQALKRTVEDRFGYVRVRGEISGFRGVHSSGHAYLALKDENAKIDAVIWRGSYAKLKVKPEEGMEVIATGRLTTYPNRSSYQIVIERLELAGLGAIMKMLEERRARLAAEGLFEAGRKKPIPHLPEVIGIVTSPTGAVIRDILHRLADRFPRRVIVWPVAVQGEGAAAQVAAAIRGFNALSAGGDIPRPDLLIVARGGGSVEDLLPFSDEAVVRAAADSAIPLISAVGHETDTTLIDFASDRRAPTPTAAAEMAVPVRAELQAETLGLARRLVQAMGRAREDRRRRIGDLARGLPRPDQLLALASQRFDAASGRLGGALGVFSERARTRLAAAAGRFRPALLKAETGRLAERTGDVGRRLDLAVARRTQDAAQSLAQPAKLLEALSHRATLARGFALVRGAAGGLKRTAGAVAPGEALVIQFHDGDRAVHADGDGPPVSPPPPVTRAAAAPGRAPSAEAMAAAARDRYFEDRRNITLTLTAGREEKEEEQAMNFQSTNPAGGKEARLRYLPGDFDVIEPGQFVRCAVTGQPVPLEALRYWSHEMQEPYASADVAFARYEQLRGEGKI